MNLHLLLDTNGRIRLVSKFKENFLGHQHADFTGSFIQDYLSAEDAQPLLYFLKTASAEDTIIRSALSFKTHNATTAKVEITLTCLSDNPTVNGIAASIRNIVTELPGKQRSAHAINASFYINHPLGILQLNKTGEITRVNTQLLTDSGYTLSDIQHKPLLNFILPQYRYKALRKFVQACNQGKASTFDVEVFKAGDGILDVNLTMVAVLFQNQIFEIHVSIKNITERLALQQTLKKLSIVADKTTNGVVILNPNFRVEWVNDGFLQMTGYKYAEVLESKISQLLKLETLDSEVLEDARQKMAKGVSVEQEMLCYRKDGTTFWNLIKATPIFDDLGKLERYIIIHVDITEKKKAEMELRLLADDLYRQNKELHQFAYIVSHNLRSPVANIVGLTNLLELFKDDADVHGQTLKKLIKSVNNLDAVIKDLSYILTVNNASKDLFKEPIHLQDLLHQVLIDLQPIIVHTDADIMLPPKPLVVHTNRAYMYSILYNLISNAIKYRSYQKPHVKIDYYFTEEHTIIYVADNGKGIDLDKHADDLFKPYKRFDAKVEGKGLGLFLVKSHVEAMGGSLNLKSKLNQGSTFYIKLPLG
ncbi:PAS domain-containing protein [Mucilaginibacter robiniae]|uniref:histidine kinase n=1 Tax=Mucilaginibacter robiniae TaxID=2728022 RepID=A0A7L5E0V3_9SPHI|nr:PAS domain-containing protein [Mucilaginibacter robiniae]QJD94453.1 PAS domain-containing protein [Mucilaginibacter robiniae]